jgi:hypothetical protein
MLYFSDVKGGDSMGDGITLRDSKAEAAATTTSCGG